MVGIGKIGQHPLLIVCALAAAAIVDGVVGAQLRTEQIWRDGEQALVKRDYAKARNDLERYLSIRPHAAGARLLAARAARRQEDVAAALEHLRHCRDNEHCAEAVEVEYALINLKRGDESAVPWLRQRAQTSDALSIVILEALIQYDIDTYRLRTAQADLDEYLRHKPQDVQALLARGYVWERFLSFADAVIDYRRAVEIEPKNERARLHLAEALLIAGTPDEAEQHFEWLTERRPHQPEVRLGLARCRYRLGQLDEARSVLDALVQEYPRYGEALWERGQLELDEGRPDHAEPWLQRAVVVKPHDRRIAYSLERCLEKLGRIEEAARWRARVNQLDADLRRLEQIRQQVMGQPNVAALRLEGGLLFLRNGEPQEGIRWLQIALRLDPGCVEARKALWEARDAGEAKLP